jgi:hypothetical protein
MESRQNKLHMPKMPATGLQHAPARPTNASLVRNAHAIVERAMRGNGTIIIEIEEFAIRDFDDGLTDDILIGAAEGDTLTDIPALSEGKRNHAQNAEFELLDHFGHPVDDLGFAGIYLNRIRHVVDAIGRS